MSNEREKGTYGTSEIQTVLAANGVDYAYRRVGTPSADGTPLVLLQHFRGNLDNWDPSLIDRLAAEREVIAVDNVGVGGTSGTAPDTVEQMADDAVAFLDALRLQVVDLFGFSLGGFVAQSIVLRHPDRVRRLVLAGTGPKGAPGMEQWADDVVAHVVSPDAPGAEDVLYVFYAHTESSQSAGGAALGRIFARQEGRDAETSLETKDTQYFKAILDWGVRDWNAVARLADIAQPTLILQGDDDIMIPTRASHTLAGLIPDARIVIFPDASHGSIFQHPDRAAAETLAFLNG